MGTHFLTTSNPVKSRSLVSNSAWNYAGAAVLLIITFVTIPLYLHALGLERYGVLAILMAILAPITVLNVGVTQATVKFVASHVAANEPARARESVAASFTINLGIGLMGAVFCACAAGFLSRFGFKIPPEMQIEAEASLRLVGLQWLFSLIGGNFRGVIEGLRDQRRVFFGDILNAILTAGLCLGFALYTRNLTGYLTGQLIATVIMSCYWWRQAVFALQGLPLGWVAARRGLRQVYGYSFWQTINAMVAVLANVGDKFFIGIFLSALTLGAYNVVLRVQAVARMSFYSVNQALFPAASAATSRPGESEALVVAATWHVSLFGGVGLAMVTVCGPAFLELWVGNGVAQEAGLPLRVLILTLLFEIPSATGSSYLNAHSLVRLTTFNNMATTVLTLLLIFTLGFSFGATGVAMGGLIGLALTRIPFHAWMHRRYFAAYVNRKDFLRAFYGVGFCCSAGALALCPVFDMIFAWRPRIDGFILAFVGSAPLLLILILSGIRFILDDRLRMREFCLGVESRQIWLLSSGLGRWARRFLPT